MSKIKRIKKVVGLQTTEDMVWITLPFRVRKRGLTLMQARRLAISYRKRDYMARVRPDIETEDRYLVATYRPRQIPAGGWQLEP